MKKRTLKKALHTPFLREHKNIPYICMSYGFTGANFIISGICVDGSNGSFDKLSIMFGIVMLCMVPISFFDRRKEMCGKLSVIMGCIMHLVLSLGISCLYSSWWIMVLYAVEAVIYMIVVFARHNR